MDTLDPEVLEAPPARASASGSPSGCLEPGPGLSDDDLAAHPKRLLALRLTVVARQLWQAFDRSVEQTGVSRAKWTLIAAVARRPGASQRLISEVLEVSEVTAGRLIESLCADGYLERRDSPGDRRARCIYLTPAAQPVLDRLSALATLHEDQTFAGLDEADLATLEVLLDTISRNVARLRVDPIQERPGA